MTTYIIIGLIVASYCMCDKDIIKTIEEESGIACFLVALLFLAVFTLLWPFFAGAEIRRMVRRK